MAEMNEIFTRIQLKYDSYSAWTTNNPTLLPGEVAIAYLGPTHTTANPDNGTHPVLFKVGPGAFNSLPWVSGLAADVYAWAKAKEIVTDGEGNAVTGVTVRDNTDGTKSVVLNKDETFATKKELEDLRDGLRADTNTTYNFSIPTEGEDAGKLLVQKKEIGDTDWARVGAYDVVTPNELTEILESYYTKTEVDDLIQGVRDDIPDELGVMSVELLAGTANGSLKLKVNDEEGADVVVTGLEEIKVKNATHAEAAKTVDAALTVKVGGADVIFDGSEAKTADVDAAIAAALAEEGHPEYSIVKDATSEYAATYHLTKDGTNIGAAINIPKDMVVEKGEVKTLEAGTWGNAGTYIVLTLSNATNDKLYINVGDLIEYVTSGSTADSQVIINIDDQHKVTATIGAGKVGTTELANNAVVTSKVADKNITRAKLADDVIEALDKDDDTTYAFADGTDGSFTVTPKGGSAQKVNIGKPANAGHADAADVADVAKKLDTRPTFGVDTEDENGIVIENASITFAGAGGGIDYTWRANDVKIGVGSGRGKGRLVVDENTPEGGVKNTTIEGSTVTTEKLVADAIHLEYGNDGVNPSVNIAGNEISVTSGQVVVKDLDNTEAVASLTSNKLTVNEAAIGGVEIKSNETATGAVKYLVFNCGSATVLVD